MADRCSECDTEHGPILKALDNYDWRAAFDYACSPEAVPPGVEGIERRQFGRVDVKEIVALQEGENDGPSWLGVFHLIDGRWAMLEAGCDYSGWD